MPNETELLEQILGVGQTRTVKALGWVDSTVYEGSCSNGPHIPLTPEDFKRLEERQRKELRRLMDGSTSSEGYQVAGRNYQFPQAKPGYVLFEGREIEIRQIN